MIITICGKKIETDTIRGVKIKEEEVLLETTEDFYRLRYQNKKEIIDLLNWQRFFSLTRNDIIDAINILIIVCDFYLNTKEQCNNCPLKKKEGCVFTTIPINWNEGGLNEQR